jgi:hypothetical protein
MRWCSPDYAKKWQFIRIKNTHLYVLMSPKVFPQSHSLLYSSLKYDHPIMYVLKYREWLIILHRNMDEPEWEHMNVFSNAIHHMIYYTLGTLCNMYVLMTNLF